MPEDRYTIIHEGETLTYGDVRLTGVYADHGDLAPEALGVLVQSGDIKVWQVADTAYRPDKWQEIFAAGVDVIMPPINGAYGNLDGVEAAKLAHDARARVAIPCHFWMFAEHGGSPAQFLDACKELGTWGRAASDGAGRTAGVSEMTSAIRPSRYKDQPAITLESEMIAAQFLPGIGAKMCSLIYKPAGTELLLQRPNEAYRLAPYDGDYVAQGRVLRLRRDVPQHRQMLL